MRRVLIIDDSTIVRLYHRRLMEQMGCQVEEAINGVEALEKALSANPFDLFLVDVNMPKMDGYRFIAEARINPSIMAVPAIMVSTEAKSWDREKAYRAGANLYLFKPVRPEVLQNYVALMAGVDPR
jgi:two-component system chemotaxis response regulator CheY